MAKCLTSADQMVLYYGFAHRSIKWWKRVFFHILDTAIVNAHILFTASSDTKLTQLEFRRAVAEGLLEGYESAKVRAVHKTRTCHFASKADHFLSRCQMEVAQIATSIVTEQQVTDVKLSTAAKNVKLPSASTPALKSITPLSTTSSLLSHYSPHHSYPITCNNKPCHNNIILPWPATHVHLQSLTPMQSITILSPTPHKYTLYILTCTCMLSLSHTHTHTHTAFHSTQRCNSLHVHVHACSLYHTHIHTHYLSLYLKL